MIELAYSKEIDKLITMPQEVQEVVQGILQILDSEYGSDREKQKDSGGYVIVVEKQDDFQEIQDKTYIDCNTAIPEYVDKIVGGNGQVCLSVKSLSRPMLIK